MFRKILVGLEGLEASWCAFRRGLALSRECGVELWALSVEEYLPRFAATIDEVQDEDEFENGYFARVQGEARELAEEQGVRLHCPTVAGQAARRIVELAESGRFDLIVVGHRGHIDPWPRLAGSTADRVVDQAPCSVLVEHPPAIPLATPETMPWQACLESPQPMAQLKRVEDPRLPVSPCFPRCSPSMMSAPPERARQNSGRPRVSAALVPGRLRPLGL